MKRKKIFSLNWFEIISLNKNKIEWKFSKSVRGIMKEYAK